MSRLRRIRLGWVIVGALLLLAGGGWRLAQGTAEADSRRELAQQRWVARPFVQYQLVLAHQTDRDRCDQTIDALDEQEVQALINTCGQPANWTVTRLFNWIAELEHTSSRCYPGPAMCACQIRTSTEVTYDQTLGYPQQITYEWRKLPNIMGLAYWRSLMDKSFPGCGKDGTGGLIAVNISLVPQPAP